MIDSSWSKQEITDFKGSWSLVEKTDIQFNGALQAKNVRFIPGSVLTRFGIKSILTPNQAITSMFNWLFADPSIGAKNFLIYFTAGGVKAIDLTAPSTVNSLYSAAGYGATFANAGSRFISAHYSTLGLGADGGRIYGWGVGNDQLFARPVLTTEVTVSSSNSAGGNMTPGTRNVAFVVTTRNGFTGRPSPATNSSALTLVPTTVTTTTVNKQTLITLTPTGTWPAFTGTARIAMTTTSNLSRYYIVPNTVLGIPAGSGIAVSTTISLSDEDLSLGDNIEDSLEFLTQDNTGAAPFNPACVFECGNRVGYVFKSSAYGQGVAFSQPNNYQAISAAYGLYSLPGQLEVVAGCYLQNSICLFGPNWTYIATDNGDLPATWAAAQKVDNTIGTICPQGIAVNAARTACWVVGKLGLYTFDGGAYSTLPVSYFNQVDWNRINWDAFYAVQVSDDASRNKVSVLAPLKMKGYVNTSGTAVTWVSDDDFVTTWVAGTTITINGVDYTISSVTSATSLTLTGSAGTQNNVAYSVSPTYNTHAMVWDYTAGDTATTVKFSLQYFHINPGAQTIVQNQTSKQLEVWYGSAQAGDVYREMNADDASPYRDGASTAINSKYETALLPSSPGRDSFTYRNHGAMFRVLGNGTMPVTCYTMDHAQTKALAPITLSQNPGREYWEAAGPISECKSYLLTNSNVADSWFQLSRIQDFTSIYSKNRGGPR